MLALSTLSVPMAAPPAAPDTHVETRADAVPDCSCPAQPARSERPVRRARPPGPGPFGSGTGSESGSRSRVLPSPPPAASADTRRGCPSSRGARTDPAAGGTARTAPPRRVRRWPRPRTGVHRDNGGTPGSTGGPTGPGPSPSTRPPAASPGPGGSRRGSRRTPRRRPAPANRAPPRPPGTVGRNGTTSATASRRRAAGWARAAAESGPHRLGLLGQDGLGKPCGQADGRDIRRWSFRAAHGGQCRTVGCGSRVGSARWFSRRTPGGSSSSRSGAPGSARPPDRRSGGCGRRRSPVGC